MRPHQPDRRIADMSFKKSFTAAVLAAAAVAAALAGATHVNGHRGQAAQLAGSKPGVAGGANAHARRIEARDGR